LVKSWLLAIPHYLVVGFFIGGAGTVAWRYGETTPVSGGGGLVALLVLFAGVTYSSAGTTPRASSTPYSAWTAGPSGSPPTQP
jgi:hypothetical protein